MARKKTSQLELIVIACVALLVAIASIPKAVWIVVGIAVVAFLALRHYLHAKTAARSDRRTGRPATAAPSMPERTTHPRPTRLGEPTQPTPTRGEEQPVHVLSGESDRGFRIPWAGGLAATANETHSPRWLRESEHIDIGPWRVPGGLIYVGRAERRGGEARQPFLIDPTLPVAATGDYVHEALPYWPSYDSLSARQRGSYLRWLIHGRRDPSANIGFVFLYFYGLEERAMQLTQPGEVATEIIPRIVHEVRALLAVYGKNNSFEHYANELLSLIGITQLSEKLYEQPLPSFPHSYDGLPFMLRVIIGQATRDGLPLAAPLALAVLRSDLQMNFRTPATRCRTEFDAMFKHRYQEIYGRGMHLPNNATKLKLEYRPASSRANVKTVITDLPDINALRKPLANLRELAESITLELEPYSRHLGRGNTSTDILTKCLLLPIPAWSDAMVEAMRALKARVGDGILALKASELIEGLGGASALTREEWVALEDLLHQHQLGLEPSPVTGVRTIKSDDTVVILSLTPDVVTNGTKDKSRAYEQAFITVQLGAMLANADGQTSGHGLRHLAQLVNQWPNLAPNQSKRLMAQLRLARAGPITLRSLQKRLDELALPEAQAIGAALVMVTHADGHVSPDHIKTLQKMYKALSLDPEAVYSAVHEAAARAETNVRTAAAGAGGMGDADRARGSESVPTMFSLDHDRIAALQAESAQVSHWLGQIFEENEAPTPATAADALPSHKTPACDETTMPSKHLVTLLGLDPTHSELVQQILTSERWPKRELQVIASAAGLMLDGALEAINDAAFDAYDEPLIEGDDPVVLNENVARVLRATQKMSIETIP